MARMLPFSFMTGGLRCNGVVLPSRLSVSRSPPPSRRHRSPLASHRIVAIADGWFAGTRAAAGQTVPLYLLPSLGGANSLRGDTTYRLHDRNLLLLKAELRVKLFTHIDWAAFAEAGNVAAAVSDHDLDRRSYGIGFRPHDH